MSASPAPTAARLRTLGAIVDDASTTFRVWAPGSRRVQLVLCRAPQAADALSSARCGEIIDVRDLTREGDGCWAARLSDVGPGALYAFRLDGRDDQTFPDPASRSQPYGVHGPSELIDSGSFAWTDARWTAPPFDHFVIYELHVGTFSPEGTFSAVVDRLPRLVDLGVTAIELMPVAAFAGSRNWGYDGVALFAPAHVYGRPDDLRRLVDAAHAHGLAMLLDVVYNHFGPDGAYANSFSAHYFTDAHKSPWGRGVNLDGPLSGGVRRFFIENAVHWVDEYHVDGLRLDATHALIDDSERHFLAELVATVRGHTDRPVYFVAEDHRNLASLLQPIEAGGYGVDAVWADDFHHQVRVHTAGDREGYYADFSGAAADVARTLEQGWFFAGQESAHLGEPRGTDPLVLAPRQFVICIQNHDQIGNRADGARLNHQIDPSVFRAISTLLALAPETPMLFMGQEWAATSPFLYFTDHNPELGRRITAGRREEFSAFAAFADPAARERIPDPQAAATFERSRLDWAEAERSPHREMRRLYERLLALRRMSEALSERPRGSFTARAIDDHTVALDYRAGVLQVIARMGGGGGEVRVPGAYEAMVILSTEDPDVAADAQPIVLEQAGHAATVRFFRPGAVVLGAHPPA